MQTKVAGVSRSFRRPMVLAAAALLGLASSLPVWAKPTPVQITVASCCVTEEVMRNRIIPGFTAYWKAKTGQDVVVDATFAGSGTLKNQILGGVPAQIGIFSSESYPMMLQEKGFITSDWRKEKDRGAVARSVIVMLTRDKNPRRLSSFADLAQPGVSVIHSNPATSGGAQWAIYAIYGSALKEAGASAKGAAGQTAARQRLAAVEKNVIAMPESAAQAMAQFAAGFGDALVTYENEALYELAKGAKYDLVVPKSTIATEWTAVRIDRNIRPEQARVVDGFLAYLRSVPAQEAFADYGFRSVLPSVTKAAKTRYAQVQLPFDLEYLGGTAEARKEIIDGYWQRLARSN